MATDGTKIIDSDTAHDTYWGIMDLYDSKATTSMILKAYPLKNPEYEFSDFENEIYVTSCGLAYWEIGLMTPKRIEWIEKIIAKNACVEEWAKSSAKEAKSRKAVLKRFLNKIKKENTKPRKPKKYRKISNYVFNENEVVTFQLKDGSYRCLICIKIDQYRGSCNYWMVPITYASKIKPSIEKLQEEMILGRTIGSGFDEETTQKEQPGIEVIWNYLGGSQRPFFGFVVNAVEHKDLLHFQDQLESIGSLKIKEGLKKMGSLRYSDRLEEYQEDCADLNQEMQVFGYKAFPISIMLEK